MDIIAYVIFVIGKLNHWQISRLSEKQSYGAAQCGGQLQFLRDALPEGGSALFLLFRGVMARTRNLILPECSLRRLHRKPLSIWRLHRWGK